MSFPVTEVVLMFLFSLHLTFPQESNGNSSLQMTDLQSEPNCTCYNKFNTLSCHCDGGVEISVYGKRLPSEYMHLTVELNCSDGTAYSPYRYLSLLDVDDVQGMGLYVIGCPPPRLAYSSLPVRKGGVAVEMGKAVHFRLLEIFCGSLNDFPLERHHFSSLDHLSWLRIDCPALTHLPEDTLAGVSEKLLQIQIRNTRLTSIPSGLFSRFHGLRKLIVSGNDVKTINFSQGLERLSYLRLTYNNIEDVTDGSFKNMINIHVIYIDSNFLSSLPECICGLRTLVILFAQKNRIRFVKAGCFASLVSLIKLNLEGNRLKSVDSLMPVGNSIALPPHLEENRIREETGVISSTNSPDFTRQTLCINKGENVSPSEKDYAHSNLNFEEMNLKSNDLTHLSEKVFLNFINLTDLDISFNRLHSLPPKIFQGNKLLRILRLNNNLLSNISETLLSNNERLEHLDLSNNLIGTLGENFFSGVTNLIYVSLSENSISFLPRKIFLPFADENGAPLILNLEGNSLASLPNLNVRRMTELNLARNGLENLPFDTLHEAYSLRSLNLSFNRIDTMGNTNGARRVLYENGSLFHGGLDKIYSVDLSHNRLTAPPYISIVAKSLKFLNLSSNLMFEAASQGLTPQGTSMEQLNLSKNNLSWILNENADDAKDWYLLTFDLPRMIMLKHLDLSWNGITILNNNNQFHYVKDFSTYESCIGRMKKLEVLILSHNNIEVMPFYFESLPKLRFVDLSHNKFKRISHEHLLSIKALSKDMLNQLGESEEYYVRREQELFELPNSHRLTIDVRHNEIEEVELPDHKMQTVPKGCHVDREFSRATMLLGHNPIVCSCKIFNLFRYSQREMRPVSEGEAWSGEKYLMPVAIDIRDLSCKEPPSMRGKCLSDPETWSHHLLPLFGLCQLLGET